VRPFVLCLLVACASSASTPRPPSADDPVGMIADAFHDHPLVAIDEGGHGNEAVHAFLERLLRDPRLPANDIVVEFGSAKYQATIDRFVAGGDVPDSELRHVWQDTTQVLVWESPIYERFFRTVRTMNAERSPSKRFRVVLADPPIDWSTVSTWADWTRTNRDAHAAEVIEREVLAKHRKALLVFGAMHLGRRNIQVNYAPSGMLVERLEEHHPGAVYTVYATPLATESPSCTGDECLTARLSPLANDPAGQQDFATVVGDAPRFGEKGPLDPSTYVALPFAKIFDALLYCGPVAFAEPSPTIFADEAYYKETVRRSHVLHDMSLAEIESLRARYLESR
jgi:hypothetical protein